MPKRPLSCRNPHPKSQGPMGRSLSSRTSSSSLAAMAQQAHVLGMLQQLIGDSKAMEVEATHAESTAQEDYEAFTKGTTASVEAKTKDITDKDAEKGATEASLVEARQSKEGLTAELENLAAAVAELQDECDYMLKNFDARQSARDDEMEALQQAKSMLSGAKA
mmetsp:Transcript_27090/g.55856  ORF Transcript_27090/g.55856 Transcript_27090/m.55856 type:complete len:164 (+) Transcript_27090:1579-2070(+)